jgi:hypothetical protein
MTTSSIPTAPSRRRFLAVLSAGAAATVAPAALAATLAPLPETASSAIAPAVVAPSPDAGLLVLFDQYMATNAEEQRLRAIYDRGRDRHQAKHPMPEVIRVQPGDAELGLPECPDHGRFGRSYICRISELQRQEWPVYEPTIDLPEGLRFQYGGGGGVVMRWGPPSPAARARADEIIEAHDRWEAKYWRKPREHRSIERQADRADKLKDRLRARIDRTRAHTVAGLAAKAQVAAIEGDQDTQFADTTLASIMRDMRALAKIGGHS